MHHPIQLIDLTLNFPHKTCFADFSSTLFHGDRIAIIGANGAGKSTLLKILQGTWPAYEGQIHGVEGLQTGYLPQLIRPSMESVTVEPLSGGQRLYDELMRLLRANPDLLLLDEPSNHLDSTHRRSMMKALRQYSGTLVMVTHDVALLRQMVSTIWHIHQGKIQVFHGHYDAYQDLLAKQTTAIQRALSLLKRQEKETHLALMKTQARNKQQRLSGEKNIAQRKWPTVRSHTKLGAAMKTGDKRIQQLNDKKKQLGEAMSMIDAPALIQHRFPLPAADQYKTVVAIQDGSIGYGNGPVILQAIHFQLRAGERIALSGNNGSGKSAFVKAIWGEGSLQKKGDWSTPAQERIGYVDQHYQTLCPEKTVLETISALMHGSTYLDIRKHLNTFLFRKNEEVAIKIEDLSGGEKARLSLCCIAASPPTLLILDEMTNNLDLDTRAHVINVLQTYPGALIVISHDQDFLTATATETTYLMSQGRIKRGENHA